MGSRAGDVSDSVLTRRLAHPGTPGQESSASLSGCSIRLPSIQLEMAGYTWSPHAGHGHTLVMRAGVPGRPDPTRRVSVHQTSRATFLGGCMPANLTCHLIMQVEEESLCRPSI